MWFPDASPLGAARASSYFRETKILLALIVQAVPYSGWRKSNPRENRKPLNGHGFAVLRLFGASRLMERRCYRSGHCV